MQVTSEQRLHIASNTIGQFNNPLYLTERKHRLTASNFASVIKRNAALSCDKLVIQILKQDGVRTAATEFGKKNELVAVQKFQEITGKTVESAGLHVDLKNGFLAASPDGAYYYNLLLFKIF